MASKAKHFRRYVGKGEGRERLFNQCLQPMGEAEWVKANCDYLTTLLDAYKREGERYSL